MLVVTANWAIADGSLVSRPRREQVEWLATLRRAAIRAGVGVDGRYTPLERLDVVLAGDTLDGLTSAAWLDRVRPWHAGRRSAEVADRVLLAAAARGRRLFGGLKRWVRAGIAVPGADGRGRADWARPTRVAVHVTALPGDRDPRIVAALPRLARRGIGVAAAWSAAGITVCHGAELDPACCGDAREPGRPTLGASLAVDLVARFGATLRDEAAWSETRGLVARLASAAPLELPAIVARWLAATSAPAARAVRERWLAAVGGWRRAARLAEPACAAACDPLDAVAAWLEGPGDPRSGGEDIALLLAPSVPPPARGSLVLGHPPTALSAGAVVCLGGPRAAAAEAEAGRGVVVAGAAVDHGSAGPMHVVFRRHDASANWAWLGGAAPATAPGLPPTAARIVEAA